MTPNPNQNKPKSKGKPNTMWYSVIRGWNPGLYENWQGPQGAQSQTIGFPNNFAKKHASREEAVDFLRAHGITQGEQAELGRTRPAGSAHGAASAAGCNP